MTVLSAAATVTLDLTPQQRSQYGGQAAWGADSLDAAGDVTAGQALGLDQSPTPVRGQTPLLVYDSQEAAPAQAVQFLVERTAAGAPTAADGTRAQLDALLDLGEAGVRTITAAQQAALGESWPF